MKALPFKVPMMEESPLFYHEYSSKQLYDKYHIHDEIQLTYILKGEGELLVGNKITSYLPHDLIAFGSGLPHAFKSDPNDSEESKTLSLYFKKSMLCSSFFNIANLWEVGIFFKKIRKGALIRKNDMSIPALMKSLKEKSDFERLIALFNIIKLFAGERTMRLSSYQFDKDIPEQAGIRMKSIIDYTMTNYNKEIFLPEIAAVANLNPNSFCRYFKKHTNRTYLEFLMEVRLNHAIRYLVKRPDLSIEEIADRSGFRNMSHFYRQFKNFKKCTPLTYRKKMISILQ